MIERRLENLLALDYPPDRLEIVVASDASTDRTDELVEAIAAREPRVRLLRATRGGKVAAQNLAVRETDARHPRLLRRERDVGAGRAAPARPHVRRPRGRLRLRPRLLAPRTGRTARAPTGATSSGCASSESRLGSVTGGNGSIYAVRREDYVDVDPRFGHDLALPYLMVQRGRGAVYEPEALAYEKPSRDLEDEYRRKVRMFEHCWLITLRGGMLRRLGPVYPSRSSRTGSCATASGVLHLVAARDRTSRSCAGVVYRRGARRQLAPPRRARRRVRGSRALLRARHAGRPSRRSRTTCAAGVPATWDAARRARGEPRRSTSPAPALALVVAAPVLAAAALAIKLEDGGPVLYRQTRVGQGRRRVRAAQAADDGRRRRDDGRRARGERGRPADHAGRRACCAGSRSTSCRSSGTSCAAT